VALKAEVGCTKTMVDAARAETKKRWSGAMDEEDVRGPMVAGLS